MHRLWVTKLPSSVLQVCSSGEAQKFHGAGFAVGKNPENREAFHNERFLLAGRCNSFLVTSHSVFEFWRYGVAITPRKLAPVGWANKWAFNCGCAAKTIPAFLKTLFAMCCGKSYGKIFCIPTRSRAYLP